MIYGLSLHDIPSAILGSHRKQGSKTLTLTSYYLSSPICRLIDIGGVCELIFG